MVYLIQYVPFGQFMDSENPNIEYYIDIYRYQPTLVSQDQPLGMLNSMIPLTAQDFGLGQLQIITV